MDATRPADPIVSLDAVGLRFGRGDALFDGLSLRVGAGEFVAVLGASGVGKTTLLRLAAGLRRPDAGEVKVFGVSPEEARDRMAFVFQEPVLLPWLDVRRNLALPLRLRGLERAPRDREVLDLARLVGLEDALERYPGQLSGGMKMRASLARALSLAPALLLCDEPFAALDAWTRRRMNEELLRLRQERPFTSLFVTHSVGEAVFLADRIVVLGGSPATVAAEFPNPRPYPRREEFRESPEFHHLESSISHQMRKLEEAGGVA